MKEKITEKLKRYKLKNKLERIISNANLKPCLEYQNNIANLNLKMNDYYDSIYYKNKKVNDSLKFSYSMNNKTEEERRKTIINYNLNNDIDKIKETDYAIQLIFKELSFKEIKKIFSDPEFYITESSIREKLDFFHKDLKLYEILMKEEKEGIETENKKLKKLINLKKNQIIIRQIKNKIKTQYETKLKEQKSKKEINEKIKQEKKLNENIRHRNQNRENFINDLISKSRSNLFYSLNSPNKIKNDSTSKIKIITSLRKKNIKKINLNTHFIKPLSLNRKNQNQQSQIFPLLTLDKLKIDNMKSTQIKQYLLEKDSQNFLNKYLRNIKNIFIENNKKENSLPNI